MTAGMNYLWIPLQAVGGEQFGSYVLIIGMIVVFYFFMIRPQQQKQKKQKQFSEGLKKGDNVMTVGGIHGRIFSMDGNTVILEVEKGMKIRIEKSFISLENTQLINGGSEKEKKKEVSNS